MLKIGAIVIGVLKNHYLNYFIIFFTKLRTFNIHKKSYKRGVAHTDESVEKHYM